MTMWKVESRARMRMMSEGRSWDIPSTTMSEEEGEGEGARGRSEYTISGDREEGGEVQT